MATKTLDLNGLPCPQPTMRLTLELNTCKMGDTIEAVADAPTFLDDVRTWCQRMNKVILWSKEEGPHVRVLIQV